MPSVRRQQALSLKPHIRRFLWVLCLPLLIPLGAVTPFVEQSHLFADDGWWQSLTWQQQAELAFLGSAAWVGGATGVAAILSFFSVRWRQKVWGPLGRFLRAIISLAGLVLISSDHLDRLLDQRERARAMGQDDGSPPKGTLSGVAGQVNYGRISTHQNMSDPSLMVVWRSTGLPLGRLVPARGDTWEVQYGHAEGSYQPRFVQDALLGRVAAPWEGVERLRQRDLQESLDVHSGTSQY